MKKTFLLLIPFITCLLPASAQEQDSIVIDSVFLSMPERVCPGMSIFDVVPEVTVTDYLRATISKVSSVQLRRLSANDGSSIICVIKTFNSPESDSEVEFYDEFWNRLSQQQFSLEDIVKKDSLPEGLTMSRLKILLQPLLVSATLNPQNTDIELTINPVQLSVDELKEIKDVKLQTTLKWNGKTFK